MSINFQDLSAADLDAIALWLAKRDGETAKDWVTRLQSVFQTSHLAPSDAKTDRIGEREWRRFIATLKG